LNYSDILLFDGNVKGIRPVLVPAHHIYTLLHQKSEDLKERSKRYCAYFDMPIEGSDPEGIYSIGVSLVDSRARISHDHLHELSVSLGCSQKQGEDAISSDLKVEVEGNQAPEFLEGELVSSLDGFHHGFL
jgi:hypothetical protein